MSIKDVSSMAGPMPAINKSPIEVCVMIPYRINGILGGTTIPSVPAAHNAPSAKFFG